MTFGLNEKCDFIFAASGIIDSRVSLALSVPDECYSRNASYLMNVIPETRRAHLIKYLCFYY